VHGRSQEAGGTRRQRRSPGSKLDAWRVEQDHCQRLSRSFALSACRVITLRPAMYVPDSYRAPNPEAAVEIIAANPWGAGQLHRRGPLASHIPVILD
jgi:hypothetical protein